MLDNFIKPYFDEGDRIWSSINFNLILNTDSINGVFLRDSTEIEVTQTRLVFTEKITASITFTQADSPLLWVQQGGSPLESPLAIFLISSIIALAGLIVSGFLSRGKNKLMLISEIIILISLGFILYFLSIEFIVVLIAAASSSTLWVVTAIFAGSGDGDYLSNSNILTDTEGLNSEEYTSFNCPSCSTKINITSNERPLRLSCSGCGKILKIVD